MCNNLLLAAVYPRSPAAVSSPLQLFRVGKFLGFLRVVQVLLLVEWVGGRRKPLPTTASMLNVLCSCSSCVLPVHTVFLCAFVSLGISIKQAKRFGDRRQAVLHRSRPLPGITSGLVTGAQDLQRSRLQVYPTSLDLRHRLSLFRTCCTLLKKSHWRRSMSTLTVT